MKKMVKWLNGTRNLLPFVGMVMAMLSQSSNMVLAKVAMTDGINKYVMIVYSMALSSFILLPLAFLNYRSSERPPPPLTFSALCSFFLLALIGSSAQIMVYIGIELSSPNLVSAMHNLIPAFTFVLALIFSGKSLKGKPKSPWTDTKAKRSYFCPQMEVMHWRHFSSQAKVLGTIVSIGGAFVMIMYKGPPIFKKNSSYTNSKLQFSPQSNWILGGLFCVGDSLLSSLWYIYQASVTRKYPAVTVIVFFQISFTTILSAVFALIAVRDPNAWKIKFDTGLIAIVYQAIAATVICYILMTWCVQKAGPLFCVMFKPIGIIFTIFLGAIFLGDDFNIGSLIGAVIIVVGFYAVLWGKAREENKVEDMESSCHNVPLLQNKE